MQNPVAPGLYLPLCQLYGPICPSCAGVRMITRSSKVTFYQVSNPNAKEVSLSQYFLLMSQNWLGFSLSNTPTFYLWTVRSVQGCVISDWQHFNPPWKHTEFSPSRLHWARMKNWQFPKRLKNTYFSLHRKSIIMDFWLLLYISSNETTFYSLSKLHYQ